MNEEERQSLAQHLAELSYRKARGEVRRLDTDARLKYWRNSIKHEWHTAYELPNVGVKVTLVEIADRDDVKMVYHVPTQKVKPVYVEARVEPLNH